MAVRALLVMAAVAVLCSCGQDSAPVERQEERAGASETNQPEETTAPRHADDGNDAERQVQPKQVSAKKSAERSPEDASRPAPGYKLIETPDGSLSAEVPPSWGVETGEDSEKDGTVPGSWSYHAGEYLNSSITTAPSLEVWYGGGQGSSGAYIVASRTLAQYSDFELTHSFINAGKIEGCDEEGLYDHHDRPPLSGKLQTWYGCGADGATTYTLAVSPEGRECVVALNARISEESERETIQHLVDTVEVNCGRVTSGPLPTNPVPASREATPSPEASAPTEATASAEVQSGGCSDPAYAAQNPGECGTTGYNPVLDAGDNYSQSVVVGDDTPDCDRPEDVLESGLCAPEGTSQGGEASSASASPTASSSASAPPIDNNPEECEYVGVTGAVHDPHDTCTAADIEAANE